MTDKYEAHRNDPPNHVGHPLGGSGSDVGWSVEARFAYPTPKTIAGMTLDDRWQRVNFPQSHAGVPGSRRHHLQECGLLDYAAAQALRWWFIANAHATYDDLCLETRLISHRVAYSYKHTAEAATDYIGGEDRSHIRPVATNKDSANKAA